MNQVKVTISKAVMAGLFQENGFAFKVIKGIPKGAELIKLRYNTESGAYEAFFSHADLPAVPNSNSIPEWNVEWQAFTVSKPKIITLGVN